MLMPILKYPQSVLFKLLLGAQVLLLAVPALAGQTSREEEIWAARQNKSTAIQQASDRTNLERALLWIQEEKLLEKLETPGAGYKGFRPKMGGLSTGSGFGYGLQYDKVGIGEQLDFSMSGGASTKLYQTYNVKLDLPRLFAGRGFLLGSAQYRSMPQEDFFGLGPDSDREARTTYGYEDLTYEVGGGVRPVQFLRLGGRLAWLSINVGPGADPRFPSTEQPFNETQAPGVQMQPDFIRSEWFGEVDYLDSRTNPRSGGFYRVALTSYDDRKLNSFGFNRTEAEIQQYLPFNNGHRIIAFRFATSLDDPKAGQEVPFYLQKSLGGSNDLRGFREFRFRDRNQMVFNLEYRWEAWTGLDMALFADAGKVFHKREDFNVKGLEEAYGIGFRFNTAKNVFLRIDIARSREGMRYFIKFENVF